MEQINTYINYIAPVLNYTDSPIMKYGEGCYIYDTEGNRYLDLNCGQFCAIFGHSNVDVAELVYRSAKKLVHLNTSTIDEGMLLAAKKVHDICPEMNGTVLLLSTGGEANECALRYAKNMSGNKPGIISFDKGYHGLTHGTEGYSISRKWVKPNLEYSYAVTTPQTTNLQQTVDITPYVKEFEDIVKENSSKIAAAIFEPIASSGGMLFPPKKYWKEIRRICTENNIYLIFDECQTGFGRTGSWFYYQQIDCVPDFLVTAKSIGLGYPVSMVIFNGNTISNEKFTMQHYSSHQNEPLSAALISFAIDEILKNNLLDRINDIGQYFLHGLEFLAQKYSSFIILPRGKGLMCGFDINTLGMTRFEAERQSADFCKLACKNGIIIQCTNYGKTVRLLPGYYLSKDDIDYFIKVLEYTIIQFTSSNR